MSKNPDIPHFGSAYALTRFFLRLHKQHPFRRASPPCILRAPSLAGSAAPMPQTATAKKAALNRTQGKKQ